MTPRSRFRLNLARWTADAVDICFDLSSRAFDAAVAATGVVVLGAIVLVATLGDPTAAETRYAVVSAWFIGGLAFLALTWSLAVRFPSRREWDEENLTALQRLVAHARFQPIPAEHRQRVAIHEAGHALLWATCETRENLSARISRWRYEGYVRGEIGPHLVDPANLYLRALGCIAGHAAELAFFGNGSSGIETDIADWQNMSKRYLLNRQREEGPVYHALPANSHEQDSNDAQLRAMREHQLRELSELFATNRDLLEELAGALNRRGRLAHADLRPYLDRFQWRPVLIPALRDREGLKLGRWLLGN